MYNILDFTLEELQKWMKENGESAFRAKQVFSWVYKEVWNFDEMKNLPGTLREKLKENYRLLIVSNCQAGYIEAFLDYYQFHDLVEDIECFGNNNKPKAENIALICERNNVAKEDAVYVGDIQGDYDAATGAGIGFIHAAYGFGTIDADVKKISEFAELPEVVKQVF